MSLNAISKHIKVLEKAELVKRKTIGRTHLIEANLTKVKVIENWMTQLKSVWEMRLNKLNDVLTIGENQND